MKLKTTLFFDKIIKTGFQWTNSVYILLVVSMSSGRGLTMGLVLF